jgi:GT2 family glycosyltransferase
MTRPNVSVVLPFLGTLAEAGEVVESLEGLPDEPGVELIVADNTPEGLVKRVATKRIRVVDASDRRSASNARNAGASQATSEWLLFVDADCELPADLVDRYFSKGVDDRTGVVAGEIVGSRKQDAFLAQWARSRRGAWTRHHLETGPHPGGITANLLVRRQVWEELGGFRIGGGGDLDLSWRAQDAGWGFEYRPDVVVQHRDRESLRELVTQAISYGSHGRYLQAIHGPSVARAKLWAPLGRAVGGIPVWLLRGDPKHAAFSAVDALWAVAFWLGDMTAGRGVRRAD